MRLISFLVSIHFVSFRLYSFRFVSIVRFSFSVDLDSYRFDSIHFLSIRFARLIIRSFVRSFDSYSILSSIPYRISRLARLRSSITVHLLYIRLWIYCALAALSRIISRVDRSDTHIDKTTPTATLQEKLL